MEKDQKRAYLFGISSVTIWSTVATAFKLSLKYTRVINLLFLASIVSTLVLFFTIIIEKKIEMLKQLDFKNILYSLVLGMLNPFLYYIILFYAYDLLRAQEAQAINYTWAITLSIMAYFFLGQKLTFGDIVGLFLSYLGVYLIATKGDIFNLNFKISPIGIVLALLSTIIWAFYWILNTKDKLDPTLRLFLNFVFGSIAITILFLFNSSDNSISLYGILGSIYVGLFEMGITFLLWSKALKFAESTAKISILIYLSPFLSLFFIHFLVGEKIYLSTIIALILILSGIAIQKVWKPV